MDMNVRKINRKCEVRGCKHTESYSISLTREHGNSIIACKDCLERALKAIKEKYEPIEEFEKAEPIHVAEQKEEKNDEAVAKINKPKEAKKQRESK